MLVDCARFLQRIFLERCTIFDQRRMIREIVEREDLEARILEKRLQLEDLVLVTGCEDELGHSFFRGKSL